MNLLISDLKTEIAQGRVVIVVGAGISVAATENAAVANWSGLLHDGVARCEAVVPNLPAGWGDRLRNDIDTGEIDELLDAAEKVERKLQGGEYRRWLRDTFETLRVKDARVIRAIAKLDVPVITTNYDSLIEEVTGWRSVTWCDESEVEHLCRSRGHGGRVLHLHGHWSEPESVILGVRDYERILKNERTQAILRALRTMKTFLFIGFGAGLADPNFAALLAWARDIFSSSEFRNFRLVRASELQKVQSSHHSDDRIHVLSYGKNYDDLADFVGGLAANPSRQSLAMPPDATEAPTKSNTAPIDSSRLYKLQDLLERALQAVAAHTETTNTLVHVQKELTQGLSALTGLKTDIPVDALLEAPSPSRVGAGAGAILMREDRLRTSVASEQAIEAARTSGRR